MDNSYLNGYRILVDGKLQTVKSLEEWALWFKDDANRRVALTDIRDGFVSTVFLGLDHSFGHGEPLWFETMIFRNGTFEDFQERYATLEQAMLGHERAVVMAKAT